MQIDVGPRKATNQLGHASTEGVKQPPGCG